MPAQCMSNSPAFSAARLHDCETDWSLASIDTTYMDSVHPECLSLASYLTGLYALNFEIKKRGQMRRYVDSHNIPGRMRGATENAFMFSCNIRSIMKRTRGKLWSMATAASRFVKRSRGAADSNSRLPLLGLEPDR